MVATGVSDFHVAVFGGLAGDKRDGPRHQAEQR